MESLTQEQPQGKPPEKSHHSAFSSKSASPLICYTKTSGGGFFVMSAKTKIVVLRMKELIYTAIFVGLGILLVILLVHMFSGKESSETSVLPSSYTPGVYTASYVLSGQTIDVAVTVDADHINAIDFVQLDEAVTTMYPLMEPALEDVSEQIIQNQSTEGLDYASDMKYTQAALVQAIEQALNKAAVK